MLLSCKAQSPIVGLDALYKTPKGAYLKDLNNELNKFEGTWKYINGTTELVIVLKKKEKVKGLKYYRDKLYGEYSYKKNGVIIVNTLPLDINTPSNIGGSYIIKNNQFVKCNDCTPDERRVDLYFYDPERKYLNTDIILRYIQGSNPVQIKVTVYSRHGGMIPHENSPTETRVPFGEYLLTKQ